MTTIVHDVTSYALEYKGKTASADDEVATISLYGPTVNWIGSIYFYAKFQSIPDNLLDTTDDVNRIHLKMHTSELTWVVEMLRNETRQIYLRYISPTDASIYTNITWAVSKDETPQSLF